MEEDIFLGGGYIGIGLSVRLDQLPHLSVAALFLVQSMQNEFLKITCKVWFQLAIGSSRLKKVDIIRKTR
jgi:hypothetical protein